MRRATLAILALLPALALGAPSRPDVALTLFQYESPSGEHLEYDDFERAVNAASWHSWKKAGLADVTESMDVGKFFGVLDETVARGGRIKFNLTSFRLRGRSGALKVGPRDALVEDSGDGAGYTAWELAQIRHDRGYFEHTDFYELRGKRYVKLTKKEAAERGIRYEGDGVVPPKLGDLDRRFAKGELVRRGAEDVFTVRGHPELELHVVRTLGGDDDLAAQRIDLRRDLLDRIAEESPDLPVSRIRAIGRTGGSLAYVQDAVTKPAVADAPIRYWLGEEKTKERVIVGEDASGRRVVTDVSLDSERPLHSWQIVRPLIEQAARTGHELSVAPLYASLPGARDPEVREFMTPEGFPEDWPRFGDSPRNARLGNAILHYLESGSTTDFARRLAADIRSGKRRLVYFKGRLEKLGPDDVNVYPTSGETFPQVVLDVIERASRGSSGLEGVTATFAHQIAFAAAKDIPDPLVHIDGWNGTLFSDLHAHPEKLVDLVAARSGRADSLDAAERAQLEAVAKAVFASSARESHSVGVTGAMRGLLDERARDATRERDRER